MVAVSANAQYLIDDLKSAFRAAGGGEIRTVVGSSGALAAQIRNGAPFDVFLSADTSYPMALWRDGLAVDTPRVYALGTLVLWSKAGVSFHDGLRSLLDPSVKKIAVANPRSAPYGAAAIVALRAGGLYDAVASKIVYGESIAQVNQYVDSRAAQIGLTSSSVVLGPHGRDAREWARVDASLYPPIPQAAIIVRRGSSAEAARAFFQFLASPEARAIFRRFGYSVP
jgi:molybdate transport system substrate-binding protein